MLPRESGSTAKPAEGGRRAGGWSMVEQVSDFFVTPLHASTANAASAAIALQLYNVCGKLNSKSTAAEWLACGAAVIVANNQRIAAKAVYDACMAAAKPPLKGWKQAKCVAAYVARLA